MTNKQINIEMYKQLICDMIQNITDERFIRQIYAIVLRETRKTGS